MATIKLYTDLEQSKKLAKILPLESADMYWMHGKLDNVKQHPTPNIIGNDHDEPLWDDYDVPCWSLTALLSVLPLPSLIQDKADDELFWKCSAYNEDGTLLCEIYDNNPVDACYEMIIKLHELNLL